MKLLQDYGLELVWASCFVGVKGLAAFQCHSQKSVCQTLDCMGWVGILSCGPGRLALEVSAELGN